MGFLPICLRAASLPHPFGPFPTNAAVLDAANGIKTALLRNVSYINIKWPALEKPSIKQLAPNQAEKP
jgi:hypothetical protein